LPLLALSGSGCRRRALSLSLSLCELPRSTAPLHALLSTLPGVRRVLRLSSPLPALPISHSTPSFSRVACHFSHFTFHISPPLWPCRLPAPLHISYPTLRFLRLTLHTPHSPFRGLLSALYILHPTLYTLRFALYVRHSTPRLARATRDLPPSPYAARRPRSPPPNPHHGPPRAPHCSPLTPSALHPTPHSLHPTPFLLSSPSLSICPSTLHG
jgi:hypothetical protein